MVATPNGFFRLCRGWRAFGDELPTVETVGYSHPFLRDDRQGIVAWDKSAFQSPLLTSPCMWFLGQ